MQKLIEVTKMIAEKYMKDINLIVEKNLITLEYLTYREGEKDVYKTLQIIELKDKLQVTFIPERIVKEVDLKGLEELILTLEKQCNVKQFTKEEIKQIKEKYVAGTKVELIKMYDYINEVPTGTKGIIDFVDDMGTLHIVWENGSSLGLIVGVDEFKIICPLCNQELKEKNNKNESE